MCGIVGFFNKHADLKESQQLVETMCSTLAHRGPDGWGTYISPDIVLGHTRLSIVDIAGGKQPMLNDRYAIVYNGEVYNYIELRQELIAKGVQFLTTSDTEVVLKAYEVYGTAAFQKFNGQFALIIWDRKEHRAIVARDRYGIRPLYVLHFNNRYFFSSEMKAFDVINGYQREFNFPHLFQHGLLWNTIEDGTVYKDIRSVPGGTYEIYTTAGPPQKFRYYQIGESDNSGHFSLDEAKELFRDLLTDAVRLRLRSDVPVGAYLSGGIDSSVISYLTNQQNSKSFKTFSVAFEDKDFDESGFQNEMQRRLNTEHFVQNISYQKVNDHFLDTVYHTERPLFRTAPVPLFLLSEKVRNNSIKVVLTGEGADEVLFGYDSFKELKLLDFWNKFPNSQLRPKLIRRLYPHLQHYSNPKQYGLMKMYYEGFLSDYKNEMAGLNIRVQNNKILENFFNSDRDLHFNKEELRANLKSILPENFSSWTILQQNHFLEMKSLLAGYLLSSQGDRMSMAHSVEGRYPFLDHRIIEQVFHFPDSYKLRVFSQKDLLKKTFSDAIPESILNRPKMPYMAPDLKSFIQGGKLSEQAAHFLSEEEIDNYGIFSNKYVQRFLRKFSQGTQRNIGYRDNMIITFLLSTQMAAYWTKHPKTCPLDNRLKNVEVFEDYTN